VVDIAGCAMPLQKIETIDEPTSLAMVQGNLFDPDSKKGQRWFQNDFPLNIIRSNYVVNFS